MNSHIFCFLAKTKLEENFSQQNSFAVLIIFNLTQSSQVFNRITF
jgi:hypothetical protein